MDYKWQGLVDYTTDAAPTDLRQTTIVVYAPTFYRAMRAIIKAAGDQCSATKFAMLSLVRLPANRRELIEDLPF